MKLHELSPAPGSNKAAYRKGRGHGSGNGKTAGKGHKGQKARSGNFSFRGFEGGQMPLYQRIPKRGFNNARFATQYAVLNVEALNAFEDGAVVTTAELVSSGIVKRPLDGIKILGNGELSKRLTVQVAAFSESAKQKIESVGGKAEVV